MTAYGKSCERCRTYFVSQRFEDRICPWCMKVETGALSADMIIEVDAP